MSKVLKVAIHEVEYAEGKGRKKAEPDSIFSIDSELVVRLEKLGAIREPTPAELALYEKQHKRAAKAEKKSEASDDADEDTGDTGDAGDAGDADKVAPKTATSKPKARGRGRQNADI